MNCADTYNLIELSDLIGCGYDLSDTQDGFECWGMRIIFCGKHPLLLTRIQVSDPGPMCILLFKLCIMAVHILKMHASYFVHIDKYFLIFTGVGLISNQ